MSLHDVDEVVDEVEERWLRSLDRLRKGATDIDVKKMTDSIERGVKKVIEGRAQIRRALSWSPRRVRFVHVLCTTCDTNAMATQLDDNDTMLRCVKCGTCSSRFQRLPQGPGYTTCRDCGALVQKGKGELCRRCREPGNAAHG